MFRSVLLIDDDHVVRRVTEITLLQQFEVYTADGGEAGLKLAEAKTPDVILLDVRMPKMDGPQTLAKLRANPITAKIPVIFLSASIQPRELEVYKRLNVLGVLEKPFDPLKLCTLINQFAKTL